MRKIKYYVATTVDGFISHEDGSWDGFVAEGDHVQDFLDSYSWFSTVLMGRKTYQVALDMEVTNPYPTLEQYVFSRSLTESPDENVALIRDDMLETVKDLKARDGKPIWLCGGGGLATQIFSAGLIDEIILKLNPVVFGKGIPMFHGDIPTTSLKLKDQKVYDNGVILLFYDVLKK